MDLGAGQRTSAFGSRCPSNHADERSSSVSRPRTSPTALPYRGSRRTSRISASDVGVVVSRSRRFGARTQWKHSGPNLGRSPMCVRRYPVVGGVASLSGSRRRVVEELTVEEQIDCDFHRVGRLGVAFKPQHFESMLATQRDLADNFGHDTSLLSKNDLRAELGSDYYHGALLDPLSAHLHVGKYVHGPGRGRRTRRGSDPRTRRRHRAAPHPRGRFPRRDPARHHPRQGGHGGHRRLHRQGHALVRKRLINVGSFVIVTEPLGEERARQLIPNNRVVVDSKNIGHYVRLTPDNRLAFGGRARFAPSNPASDVKSGDASVARCVAGTG
jgi:glycine/D-amino acid oxidase-like deaminating enzyme